MKIGSLFAIAFAFLNPNFAQAAILCADAAGHYGFIHVSETSGHVTIDARQGYSVEISQQLGFDDRSVAEKLLVTLPASCRHSDELVSCQGAALVQYQTFVNGSGQFDALVDLEIVKERHGHKVTLKVAVPSIGKTAEASHSFIPFLGECNGLN